MHCQIIKEGDVMDGTVESSTNFGVFISLQDGITGLLPRSRVRRTDNFKGGDVISMQITAIDNTNRRITLDYSDRSPEELEEIKAREDRSREDRPRDDRPRERREQDNRSFSDRPRKGGGRGKSDEEWRRYANQKQVDPDNPFKNL